MALTLNQRALIEAVQKSDMQLIKKAAIACVTEDTSKKNEWWCRKYKNLLEKGPTVLELPYNIQGMATLQDLSESFLEDRYFLSEREQAVFNHILQMSKANEELAKRKIHYLNSVLLYGPSGTGKTTFGQYLAYKMELPFLYINFSNLIDSHMGATSQNVSRVFSWAKDNKCVFLLDEIDTISVRRGKSGGSDISGEMSRITVTLMQEFDKLSNEHIVIGATNRIDMIDEALLRRFSKKHEVRVLTVPEKIKMVTKYLNDVDISYDPKNVETYCQQSEDKPQSQIINEVIESIIQSISGNVPFSLPPNDVTKCCE